MKHVCVSLGAIGGTVDAPVWSLGWTTWDQAMSFSTPAIEHLHLNVCGEAQQWRLICDDAFDRLKLSDADFPAYDEAVDDFVLRDELSGPIVSHEAEVEFLERLLSAMGSASFVWVEDALTEGVLRRLLVEDYRLCTDFACRFGSLSTFRGLMPAGWREDLLPGRGFHGEGDRAFLGSIWVMRALDGLGNLSDPEIGAEDRESRAQFACEIQRHVSLQGSEVSS